MANCDNTVFFRPKLGDLKKKKKKKKKKKVFAKIQSEFSAEIQNSNDFFRPKLGDLQKKKRSSPKFRVNFRPKSKIQTFFSAQKIFFRFQLPDKKMLFEIRFSGDSNLKDSKFYFVQPY